MTFSKTRRGILILLLLTSTAMVYLPVRSYQFLGYDDLDYVTENPWVKAGLTRQNLAWAFTSVHASNWHPITWLSHMLDVEFFGLDPGAHHLMNLAIHSTSVALLFVVLCRMTGAIWRSAFIAALLAVHPLHVQSVAWIAERKNLLCAFFWIMTMGAYLRYASRCGIVRYAATLAVFGMALMSKPMAVTLPLVLLLLDWWPLGRWQWGSGAKVPVRLFLEKIPFLALSAGSAALTLWAQARGNAVASFEHFPLGSRLFNAATAYIWYVVKFFWPEGLAFYYPHRGNLIPSWQVGSAVLLLLMASVLALRHWRRSPYFSVGLFWYLLTLLPVIGLIQVGSQAVADRYVYLPLLGFTLALGWGLSDFFPGFPRSKAILTAFTLASLTALMAAARMQTGYWREEQRLFEHALKATSDNWLAHTNLGASYYLRGDLDRAIDHYREALRIKTDNTKADFGLGYALLDRGEPASALSHFRRATMASRASAAAWVGLGLSLSASGNNQEAARTLVGTLRLEPGNINAHAALVDIFVRLGQTEEALAHAREVIRLKPSTARTWAILGKGLASLGYLSDAATAYRNSLKINPKIVAAKDGLDEVLQRLEKERAGSGPQDSVPPSW